MNGKWDKRMLDLAELVAFWSKDPSTKVGAVIADENLHVVSLGYNGLPRGIDDSDHRLKNRDVKYEITIHAEVNAILSARPWDASRCCMFVWPAPPCARCAAVIVQSGIKCVVSPPPSADYLSRWDDSVKLMLGVFAEAEVNLRYVS